MLRGCHRDAEATTPAPIVPDPGRITAAVEGSLARAVPPNSSHAHDFTDLAGVDIVDRATDRNVPGDQR